MMETLSLIVPPGAYSKKNIDNMTPYSVTQKGSFLQVSNALTGAIHFTISIAGKGMTNYMASGNTLTISYQGRNAEVWNLDKRQQIR